MTKKGDDFIHNYLWGFYATILGGKVIFDGVSAGYQININGTMRTISGSKLK